MREYFYLGSQLIASKANGEYKWYVRDHLSPRGVYDEKTASLLGYGHLPFGESWYGEPNEKMRFTTYEREAGANEVNQDFAVFRQYSSGWGRFTSADPVRGSIQVPQSWNRYTYALNDPINLTDPLGLNICLWDDHTPADPEDGLNTKKKCEAAGGNWFETDTTITVYSDGTDYCVGVCDVSWDPWDNFFFPYFRSVRDARDAPPDSEQYIAAISESIKSFPNVCGVGGAGYFGDKIAAGLSADTQNGIHFASGFNFVNIGGFKVNYTISGGANGNISYSVPIPLTKVGIEVGTENGSLRSIQSVALSSSSGYKNATVYMNISNMGDPNCK